MTERALVEQTVPGSGAKRYKWEGLAVDDTGAALGDIPEHPYRSVQAVGGAGNGDTDFDSGNITIQGSNDGGTSWGTVKDVFGNDAVISASGGLVQLGVLPQKIRPIALVGTTMDVDVFIYCKRAVLEK